MYWVANATSCYHLSVLFGNSLQPVIVNRNLILIEQHLQTFDHWSIIATWSFINKYLWLGAVHKQHLLCFEIFRFPTPLRPPFLIPLTHHGPHGPKTNFFLKSYYAKMKFPNYFNRNFAHFYEEWKHRFRIQHDVTSLPSTGESYFVKIFSMLKFIVCSFIVS